MQRRCKEEDRIDPGGAIPKLRASPNDLALDSPFHAANAPYCQISRSLNGWDSLCLSLGSPTRADGGRGTHGASKCRRSSFTGSETELGRDLTSAFGGLVSSGILSVQAPESSDMGQAMGIVVVHEKSGEGAEERILRFSVQDTQPRPRAASGLGSNGVQSVVVCRRA